MLHLQRLVKCVINDIQCISVINDTHLLHTVPASNALFEYLFVFTYSKSVKVQSCKLCNSKYIITTTLIKNT